MRLFRFLLFTLIVFILLFLIIALFLPDKIRVKSSIEINTPVNVVFKQVNNLNNWINWSPFLSNEPDFKIYISKPDEGEGAVLKWENRANDDYGNIELTEVRQNEIIIGKMNFRNLNEVVSNWNFSYNKQYTTVEWVLDVVDLSYPFGRWKGIFMKSKISPYYQDGLENLKAICENIELTVQDSYQSGNPEIKNVNPVVAYSIKDSCTFKNFSSKFREVFGEITNYMNNNNIEYAGSPFCIFYSWNPDGYTVFEAGIPTTKKIAGKGRIVLSELYGGKTVSLTQLGPYESVIKAHDVIKKYINDNNMVINGYPWEVYITDINNEPNSDKWETQIFYPVE